MKKTLVFGLLSMVIVLFIGCETPGSSPYRWEYHCQIYIDSTAAACEVDSCVINLPWLHGKIEQAFADTVGLRDLSEEARNSTEAYSKLEIYLCKDTTYNTYYFVEIDDLPMRAIIYNCDGYIVKNISNEGDFFQFLDDSYLYRELIINIGIGWDLKEGGI